MKCYNGLRKSSKYADVKKNQRTEADLEAGQTVPKIDEPFELVI